MVTKPWRSPNTMQPDSADFRCKTSIFRFVRCANWGGKYKLVLDEILKCGNDLRIIKQLEAQKCSYDTVCLFLVESVDLSPEDLPCDRLTFYHFDISRLLKHGASLLGSAGAEFELQDEKTGL